MPKKKKRVVFLKGKKVILRPMSRETDLAACQRWINDPEVRMYLLNRHPITLGREAEWFDKLDKSSDDIVFTIETKSGVIIGVMSLNKINMISGTAVTGAVIGEKRYWNKGYGTDAKMILLDYAFNTLNLRKVCSGVFGYNKRSIGYSLKCGYKIEGRQKKHHYINGTYHDNVLLAVFKKDWLPIWNKYNQRTTAS